jgi:lipopolysaccharide transport protein LptA
MQKSKLYNHITLPITAPLMFTVISLLTLASPASAEVAKKSKDNTLMSVNFEKGITTITSKELTLKSAERKFIYTGSVEVLKDDMTLKCDILEGMYGEDNQITDLVARNNVFITQGEGTKAKSNKAVYNKKNETVTLTENPEIEQKGSILSADKITMFIKEDRSTAEGTVKVKLVEGADGDKKSPLTSVVK